MGGITDLMDMCLSKLQGIGKHREAWWAAVCGVTMSQTRLSDCITTGGWEFDLFPGTEFYEQSCMPVCRLLPHPFSLPSAPLFSPVVAVVTV